MVTYTVVLNDALIVKSLQWADKNVKKKKRKKGIAIKNKNKSRRGKT